MAASKRTLEILKRMDDYYTTDIRCSLDYSNTWELLVATMLSAQCTDQRVNIITKELFRKYKTIDDYKNAELKEFEEDIRQAGFYHNKAKNIIATAGIISQKYDGRVPETLEELTALPGVGRKTANVIRGNIYHIPSIVVDTHVKRISKKLGFTDNDDPEKVEFDLMKKIPKDHWILVNVQMITHGREICIARKPHCESCFLNDLCKHSEMAGKND